MGPQNLSFNNFVGASVEHNSFLLAPFGLLFRSLPKLVFRDMFPMTLAVELTSPSSIKTPQLWDSKLVGLGNPAGAPHILEEEANKPTVALLRGARLVYRALCAL